MKLKLNRNHVNPPNGDRWHRLKEAGPVKVGERLPVRHKKLGSLILDKSLEIPLSDEIARRGPDGARLLGIASGVRVGER